MTVTDSTDPASWRKQLDALPVGGRIPTFFFAHGCMNLLLFCCFRVLTSF